MLSCLVSFKFLELFKGERTENSVDNEYENLLSDVVKVSANEITKKKKTTNWMIAITAAVLYLMISVISHKWEIT